MKKEIVDLYKKYDELKGEINKVKADGNLSMLCNLNMEFDETFDKIITNTKDDDYDEKIHQSFLEQYIEYLEDELECLKCGEALEYGFHFYRD